MSFTAGAGTRFVVTSTASQSSGTVLTGPITATAGTATTNTPAFDITQTWNNAAVTFTGLRFNVTDTASNASSLLLDLQTGGSSRFLVTKGGAVRASNQVLIGPAAIGNITGLEDYAGGMIVKARGSNSAYFDQAALQLPSNGLFGWTLNSNNPYGSSADTVLARDAANTLAQRNGVNAQTFRIYNTFTDASNYERLSVDWTSNVAYIRPQNAGTGSARIFVPVTGSTTVAGLPAAATAGAGARAFVTDANATTFASVVAGGGANAVPVVSNGTNWIIG